MRYTGPRGRRVRRLAQSFTEKEARILQRRSSPPGQHGQTRGKLSEFALQMREKQRVKYAYGLTEKQFYRLFLLAQRQTGPTGDNLFKRLELRLDNVVYRLAFSSTRPQARQLVTHGFVSVNGKKVNIPSVTVRPGDTVSFSANKRSSAYVENLKSRLNTVNAPDWLEVSSTDLAGKVLAVPDAQHAESLNSRLVVEHYQRI